MGEAKVTLRAVTEDDLPDYVRWLNDPEVTAGLGREAGGVTLEGEREWLAKASAPDCSERVWAIAVDGRLAGTCALTLRCDGRLAKLGIFIGEQDLLGRGYGTAALRLLLAIGFGELGLDRIQLDTFADNPRALRAYEKVGFRQEGLRPRGWWKRSGYHDLVSMGLLREQWEAMESPAQGAAVNGIHNPAKSSALYPTLGYVPRPVGVMGKDLEPRLEGE